MNVFIVGYGSAGKRWHKYLQGLPGLDITTYDPDPFAGADYNGDFGDGFWLADYHIAIIATPVESHLDYIEKALNYCVVLCEKPACDFGQLERFVELGKHINIDNLVFAYNYLYHPSVMALGSKKEISTIDAVSVSRRIKAPESGFLIDNFSHTVAILTAIEPKLEPIQINIMNDRNPWAGMVWFRGGSISVLALEMIHAGPAPFHSERVAGLQVDGSYYDTTGHMDIMMGGVWGEVRRACKGERPHYLHYKFALVVQQKLEKLRGMSETT